MNVPINISNFNTLSVSDKIQFLEHGFMGSVQSEEGKVLNCSLSDIVLNENENTYVRRIGLRRFIDLVAVDKLKERHALGVLIDDWPSVVDVHIELQRLKDLYLFYDTEPEEIEKVYQSLLANESAEIVSESNLNLGLIRFQNALKANDEKECLSCLKESKNFFTEAENVIENRIDAFFYFKICSILIDLISYKSGSIQHDLEELGQILFEKEAYSIRFEESNQGLQFCLYKILNALQKILNSQPKEWIDFRTELEGIMISFLEIKDNNFKSRLNTEDIPTTLAEKLEKKFLQPFFLVNLNSDIYRIKKLKAAYSNGSPEHNFLNYLQTILEGGDKKKIELESLRNKLQNIFPHRTSNEIEQQLTQVSSPEDYISFFEQLSAFTDEQLFQKITYSCSLLQGDQDYWGAKSDENRRNRYLANLLKSNEFIVSDQPQWSKSSEGINPGEIDIFIHNKDNTPLSIIEALNLDSLRKEYWALHIDKLFTYDTTGLRVNYLIVYYTGKNLSVFWTKYKKHIQAHNYQYANTLFEIVSSINYTDIKAARMKHLRSGEDVFVYHIVVNMADR